MLLTPNERLQIYEKVQWLIEHSHVDEEKRFEVMTKMEKDLEDKKRSELTIREKERVGL